MRAILFNLYFIFLLGLKLQAQQSFKEVYLLDLSSKTPIPYALLVLETNTSSYLSDENGKINLSTKHKDKELIEISHVSIENTSLFFDQIEDTIFVRSKEYILAESFVENQSALSLVKKSIAAINQNYGSENKYFSGLYRQIHKEDGKYVRLIEAQIDVVQESTATNLRLNQEEKFHVSALRKSLVYEKNGEQHGDHLADLFTYNPIQYLEKGIFNPSALESYSWEISLSNASLIEIKFQNKPWSAASNYCGIILINKEDLAMLKIEIYETPNSSAFPKPKSTWSLLQSSYSLEYIKSNSIYQLQACKLNYAHHVKPSINFDEKTFLIEEEFNFGTNHSKVSTEHLDYNYNSNLYRSALEYKAEQWNSFVIEDAIARDLGLYVKLDKQFRQER